MTDRHSGYTIVLADDIRDDDAEAIVIALQMVKGVAKVVPIVADYEHVMARARRDHLWADRLLAMVDEMRFRS